MRGARARHFFYCICPWHLGWGLKENINIELYKKGSYIDYVLDSFLLLLVDVGGPRRFGVTQEQL